MFSLLVFLDKFILHDLIAFLINRIYYWSPMQTETFQSEGKWIMPQTRLTEVFFFFFFYQMKLLFYEYRYPGLNTGYKLVSENISGYTSGAKHPKTVSKPY